MQKFAKILTKIYYRICFLIPLSIGIALWYIFDYQTKTDWIGIIAVFIGTISMMQASIRYGYDESYRKKLRLYKEKRKSLPRYKRSTPFTLESSDFRQLIFCILLLILFLIVVGILNLINH